MLHSRLADNQLLLPWELSGTQKPTPKQGPVGAAGGQAQVCRACLTLGLREGLWGCLGVRPGPACLPVPCRPFIKLKENGRANISRSSSSTSSFSSTAGEGEAMEECDSGVGAAPSNPGEQRGAPWAQGDTALCIKIAPVGRASRRLGRLKGK